MKLALTDADSPAADIVSLNAGAAIYVAGISTSLANGVIMAQDAIASGLAKERLDELKRSALEQFGTDDVQQLKKQLDKLNKENESKRVKYEKDLNAITDALNQIDENLENDEDLS